jgi:hypothetical protein
VKRLFAYLWAFFPGTFFGLAAGLLTLMTGGKGRRVGGTLEFWGGFSAWYLRTCCFGGEYLAMTLGHVIIGRNAEVLEMARTHELIHVRQFERWGPFMIPSYLLCSAYLWMRGKRAYWDNPFEREAYENS